MSWQQAVAQAAGQAAGFGTRNAVPIGIGAAALGAGALAANAMNGLSEGAYSPYASEAANVARFQAQGMGGGMEGAALAAAAMDQEARLRANQEYQMGQQQRGMEFATALKRDMERDQAAQAFAQQAAMGALTQDYAREGQIRDMKSQQASALLNGYLQGRSQAGQMAQGAFRSVI